jgi:SAM-dependent methyltransferase
MHFEHGPNGRVIEHEFEVGRVVAWEPPARVLLEWHPAEWEPDHTTAVELRLEAVEGGTRTMVEHRGWGRLVGGPEERTGWFADQVAAPLLKATAPAALGDWLTDRQARRPSGAQSRSVYRDPLYHYPNFRVIHQELALGPHDYLLEVGCGGGAMLKEALRSGCRAAAVDHSADMVALATAENRQAVADGRLEIRQASADRLPFADSTFSHAAMTGVLGFLPDPMAALSEIRRVLARGGTFVTLGSDVELKGTPGAPEPMASRLQFYDDDQLAQLARGAGFDDVHVIHRDLEPFAREAGVPEEHLMLFAGPTTRFLIAHKG